MLEGKPRRGALRQAAKKIGRASAKMSLAAVQKENFALKKGTYPRISALTSRGE